MENKMILGENLEYSLDCHKTQLNNNVLVVGAAGSGKTRSIVIPNILQATGSYIISDPKGNLYEEYGDYLKAHGYKVMKLDFANPGKSPCHYNFFKYLHTQQDIAKLAHIIIWSDGGASTLDPFWDQTAEILLCSLIAYLKMYRPTREQTLENVMMLIRHCQIDENDSRAETVLDKIMNEVRKKDPTSYALKQYDQFRVAAGKTLRSILISLVSKIGKYDYNELNKMMAYDSINLHALGQKKTALFVVVSDHDRSMDGMVNIFYSQAINELCEYADKSCKNCELPINVRFILDDFATNCKIADFPRIISSVRSRGISTMLMIQAEAQLKSAYGSDNETIIGNCDTYVYLGGNDIETAKSVSVRSNQPLNKILNLSLGDLWLFRRGEAPQKSHITNFDKFVGDKMYKKNIKNERSA